MRLPLRLLEAGIAAGLAAALAACSPQTPDAVVANAERTEHEFGRAVYNFRCYFCHGYSGDARTVAASFLAIAPRDFTRADATQLDEPKILRALRDGRPGTAMKSYSAVISERELRAVAGFVHRELVIARAANTHYHTAENGWPDHQRYRAAYPFATGEIAPGTNDERLDAAQAAGKRLFMGACVTCHDRGGAQEETVFALRSVSYPLHNYIRQHEDTVQGGADPDDPYEKHERTPALAGLTPREQRGEALFRRNCAFCHAHDGSGRNWIGAFIDPPPADFTQPAVRRRFTAGRLREVVRDGVANTSMPAWGSVLSRAEIEAVVAYMLRAFPATERAAGAAIRGNGG